MLGPVQVWVAGQQLKAGSRRQRTVLAVLAMDPGRPVTVDTLVDLVWNDAPPDRPRESLYVYVSRLRTLLEHAGSRADTTAALVHTPNAYQLDIDPQHIDVYRFRVLAEQARHPDCPDEQRVMLLRQALALWRETPLSDLSGAWAERVREGLVQQHLDATMRWAQAELHRENPDPVIEPLADLIHRQPLAERPVAMLMRVLYTAGRTADALEQYQRMRKRLVEQLGVDPGSELQDLHRAILRGEPDGRVPAPTVLTPAQLPPDVFGFAGRADELRRLDALLADERTHGTAVVVSAVSGMAGVGKTALAVHWAHEVAHRFPGGQLFANLRGFDPAGPPAPPAEVLRGFLEALGVAPERVPARFEGQVGLYRSLLAGRRVLVVLDNARDAEQVRPLLPGSPGCLALVTSRNQLVSLSAGEGAQILTLAPLTTAEARQLLVRRLGERRTAAEPRSVDGIIAGCAHLPLALSIVAARAAVHPRFALATLAAELTAMAGSLDAFTGDDSITDVRTVFSWSYQTLGPAAARLFRLLGVQPGPDITVTAAASLAGSPVARVRRPLAELTRAHLVAEHVPGRYSLHDLLRSYTAELAERDPDDERRSALHRILDYYLHTAYAADALTRPYSAPMAIAPAVPAVTVEPLADEQQALAWLTAERTALLAAVRHAVAAGFDRHGWQLAWAIANRLDLLGQWQDQVGVQTIALAAARRTGERNGQAVAYRSLGRA